MITPIAGNNYRLSHSRFGLATVRVDSVDDEWAQVTILQGVLRGMTETWGAGDKKAVRLSNSKFYNLDFNDKQTQQEETQVTQLESNQAASEGPEAISQDPEAV